MVSSHGPPALGSAVSSADLLKFYILHHELPNPFYLRQTHTTKSPPMAQPLTSIVTRPCTVHLLHQIGPSLIGAGIAGQRGFRLGRRALEKDGEGKNAEETDTKTTESAKPEEQKKEELLSDALSRRLASMAEDAVYENPRLARDIASGKASAEDYGFSEILKQQLQDKLESAKFNDEYAQAISASKLPVSIHSSQLFSTVTIS